MGSGYSPPPPSTFSSEITAVAFDASGKTGAQQASRYVGATSSGAPVSGTFAVGDFIIDRSGAIWICTVAGTPGTWVSGGGTGVSSFNTRTGAVTLLLADVTGVGGAPLASPTFTGTTTAPEFSASGLTGATQASRYVGATASGAPGSGAFAVGDFVVAQDGNVWVCTSAGSPGTFRKLPNTTQAVSFSSTITGTALIASGLTGATQASRYVGATASGAPASGTFAVGDFVIDQSGSIRICTVAGTPGTWVAPGGVSSVAGRTGAVTLAVADVSGAAPTASPTFTGTTTAPEFSASGLTGATQASRYVGATASVAPSSGTFAVGDFVISQTGHVFICTVAGTPGTFVDAGSVGNLVTSVAGRTGAVTLAVADVSGAAPLASPTFTGTTTAPEFSASGLTGATQASRYVGATASVAPSSGTFAVGDFVISQTGKIFVCTVAGTPGTWVDVSSGAVPTYVGVRVRNSTDQSIADSTHVKLAFNAEPIDTNGFHDNATNNSRLTVPSGKAGTYTVYWNVMWNADSALGARTVSVYVNGASIFEEQSATSSVLSGFVVQSGTVDVVLAVGDYVELDVVQNSGTTRTIAGAGSITNAPIFGMRLAGV